VKGTYSIDKQKGSTALMKQLVSYQAYGIIATQDLALGKLKKALFLYIRMKQFQRLFYSTYI